MSMLSTWSFRKKLIFLWFIVQLFVTVIAALLVVRSATDFIEKDISYQSEQIQPILNSALVTPLIQRDYASVIAILKELIKSENIEKISVRDASGNLLAQESHTIGGQVYASITPYFVEFPIRSDGIELGKVAIDISRVRLIETRTQILYSTGIISILILFVFFVLITLISNYITRPIAELASITSNIAQGNFAIPAFNPRRDEIGSLQKAFQSMSFEIEKRIDDLKKLNADLEIRVLKRTESLEITKNELAHKVDNLKLFGAVIDNSYFGISITDLADLKSPLIYVNPAFTKVTGYKADEVIGKQHRIFQKTIPDVDAMNQINSAIVNKSACTVEFLDKRFNGEEFWNRLSVFPVVIADSNPRFYVIFENDISALKKTSIEREVLLLELHENQRLQSLGILIAGLAHEINNPIGIALTATTHISQNAANIRNHVENLKGTELSDFLEDEEIAFQLIFDNLRRASELVRGFKDIATDRSLDDKRTINLHAYIQSIKQSLTPVLNKARCMLNIEVDPAITVLINTGSLGQLLTNLVLNSTIHAFDGITDREIQIKGYQDGQSIHLKISDNGNGIPASSIPNLFTPFHTTNRSKGGTGLGLYISKQIATDVLKGSLNFNNLPNRGCEFELVIPLI